jgi:hypothetical protein
MRLKLPAIAVAAASLALAGGAEAAAAPVYFSSYPGEGIQTALLKVRPTTLQISGDASFIIDRIRWSSWGGPTAAASGLSVVERCTPTCAGGGVVTTQSTITLSRLRTVRGRRVYECIAVVSRGPRSIATERANFHECLERATL